MRTSSIWRRGLAGLAVLAILTSLVNRHAWGGKPGQSGAAAGDDDIGSMPSTAVEDAPSLWLVGTWEQLGAAVQGIRGSGTASLRPLGPGSERLLLEIEGDMEVLLDLGSPAATGVSALFNSGTTFDGGAAALLGASGWSRSVDLGLYSTFGLDLEALAGGEGLLRAVSAEGQAFTLLASDVGSLVRVRQGLR